MKEKHNASSNPVVKNIVGYVSHLAMNIIRREIERVSKANSNLENLCRHYI